MYWHYLCTLIYHLSFISSIFSLLFIIKIKKTYMKTPKFNIKYIVLFLNLLLLPFLAVAQKDAPRHIRGGENKTETTTTVSPKDSTKQKKQADQEFNRWYYGGNIWFGGSNGFFQMDISPQVGYRITQRFMVGAGILFQPVFGNFNLIKNNSPQLVKQNVMFGRFGGDVFSRFQVLDWLFVHGEYQYVEFGVPTGYFQADNKTPDLKFTPVPSALLGAGAYTNAGPVRLQIMALYNFLYDSKNLYDINGGPIVLRGGVGIGF